MSRSPSATSSRTILLVILFLAGAAGAVLSPSAGAQEQIRFLESSASASFPESITFQMTAESDIAIEEVELYWHLNKEPTLTLSQPEFEPGTRVEVTQSIDTTVNYKPPGTEVSYWWRLTDAEGNVVESEAATFTYMDDRHDWNQRTEGLVSVWWYDGGDQFAGQVLESAHRAIDRLSNRFAIETDYPVRILVYGNDDDFSSALAENSAEWIGGAAYPQYDLVMAQISPGTQASREIGRMIPHEISHLITYRATENPYNGPPSWLDEGLATYNQDVEDTRLAPILQEAVDDGLLIPIQALNSSFPLDPDRALLSYAESESIVEFVIERFGDAALGDLVAIFTTGVSYDQAVKSTLGVTIEELDAQWKAWLGYEGDAPDAARASSPESSNGITREAVFSVFITGTACLGVFALVAMSVFIFIQRRRA